MCSRLKSSTQVIKDTGFTLQVALLHVTLVHPESIIKTWNLHLLKSRRRLGIASNVSLKKNPLPRSAKANGDRKGYDESTWDILSTELAITGLIIPEEFGGSGFGATELGIVMEQFADR